MSHFNFEIIKKSPNSMARRGRITTPHGVIETPAFVTVGTKASVKAMTPEMVASLGAQVVLANTYHLYLQPGDDIVATGGGLSDFMNWPGPTMTDSGGFQVFSLGAAFGSKVSKIAKGETDVTSSPHIGEVSTKETEGYKKNTPNPSPASGEGSAKGKPLATIDEDGVTFRSHLDGSQHRFTPESSMEVQWNLGADMIFAFDECTSPVAPIEYQREAMDRTHRWARRSLQRHVELDPENKQALFGVVQGGRYEELRKESARVLAEMRVPAPEQHAPHSLGEVGFDGFGIGGSFNKDDMGTAVRWVNEALPEDKPRHLLGIGEPDDLRMAIENGCDLFDCVAPTRNARNGSLYTDGGRLNIFNARFKKDFTPIESGCGCYTCQNYTRAYLHHLFKAKEMLASTLATVHNLYYVIHLVDELRNEIG